MFWRSIPRATEVLGPSRSASPPVESDQPPPIPPRPPRLARALSSSRSPPEPIPSQPATSPKRAAPMLSLRKSNSRLRRLAQGVIDRNREQHPTHLCDVVEQVMAHPERAGRPKTEIKRTKSLVSLFRRPTKPRQEEESDGETDRQLRSTSRRGPQDPLHSHRGSTSSSSVSSVLSDSSGFETSPRHDRFEPTAPRGGLEAYLEPQSPVPATQTYSSPYPAAPSPHKQRSQSWQRADTLTLSELARCGPCIPAASVVATRQAIASPTAVTGLINVGNSCYLASVVQALLATQPLARFFLDDDYLREVNTTNRLGSGGQLAEAFANLSKVAASGEYRSLSPAYLKDALAEWAPQYAEAIQQDAHECLLSLLDGLHEDLNLVLRPPRPVRPMPAREAALQQLPEVVAADLVWKEYRDQHDSVIVDFFHGQIRNRMECLRCHTTSSTFHALQTLSLALPPPRAKVRHTPTLQDCLADHLQEEILRGENAWRCPTCQSPQVASKRVSIARLPQFLVIHLQRFAYDAPKLSTSISFPLAGLELGGLLPPLALASPSPYALHAPHEPGTSYELYAAVCHHGQDGSGHYTALVHVHHLGEGTADGWCEVDDEEVTVLSTPDALDAALLRAEQTAYLLFYRISR
ncbi:hypothetical protein JCM3774_001352 [Rhodotorula dairenensis]